MPKSHGRPLNRIARRWRIEAFGQPTTSYPYCKSGRVPGLEISVFVEVVKRKKRGNK